MKISRHFTAEGQSPYTGIAFEPRTSEIRNPDGSSVFKMDGVMVPKGWSQVATDILAQKYFRKAGLTEGRVGGAQYATHDAEAITPRADHESDARAVFHRLAGCWTHWGQKGGYFTEASDAQAFYDELVHMMARQTVAPELAPVVQHRPPLRLRHRGRRPGPPVRGPRDGQSQAER